MTASQKRGTICIGVTNDLGRRMTELKSDDGSRFASGWWRSVLVRWSTAARQRHGSQGLRRVAALLAPPWDDEARGVSANLLGLRSASEIGR
ncbi:hypothetical protein [Mesorhizobium mediterraneum]|uniref:hypothetical protein n=1 Tax=Mesorhizobium mediterraneum TaxID=43617 RepID=UPI001782E018|nr:hypothetical protein [Mesorhizobium mediterraneum]